MRPSNGSSRRRGSVGFEVGAYKSDALLCSAVERQGEILWEAMSQIFRVEPGLGARIKDAGRIVAFRNLS